MLCAVRSGCGPWDRLGRSPHLVLHRYLGTLWGEAGRWIPRARSRRGADSCHVSAAETSMPGQGWIARMKSTTRHVAGERAVAHAPRQLAWSCAWAWRRGAPRRACVMRGGRGQAGGGRALSSRAAGSALRRPSSARGLPRSGRGGEGTTVHADQPATIDRHTDRQTVNVKKKQSTLRLFLTAARYLRALSSALPSTLTLPCPTSLQLISAGRSDPSVPPPSK